MKVFFISGTITLLALFGGMQAYLNPLVTVGLVCAGWVTAGASFFVWRKPPLWPALLPLCLAALVSGVANTDIAPTVGARLWLYGVALSLLFVTSRLVTSDQLLSGLLLAAGPWLLASVWMEDNPNIKAVWAVVFILAMLGARLEGWANNWQTFVFCTQFLIYLSYLGSRGAVVGLTIGLFTLYALRTTHHAPRLTLFSLGGLLLAILLILWRPETAGYRLHYWQQALGAFLAKPFFGVGPGGLWARQIITEPGGGFQIHAHNFIISSVAEMGLVGLAALLYAGKRLYALRFALYVKPWQLAIVTALLGHSLVDEPLFWPGPLLFLALVLGTIQKRGDR